MKYAVAFASAVSLSTAALGAEVTVMSGGAVKSAFTDAAKAWERKTGNKVTATFAPAGELRKKIAAGESADVLIVPRENVAEFDKAGALASGSDRDLAGVAMGAAVRKGAPVPDISTPEALKRTLIETKSLTYMDPTKGTSGKHFDESVLPALGIRDQVRAKTTFGEGGYIAEKVAKGEVDMAFHQITEIMPVAGVTVAVVSAATSAMMQTLASVFTKGCGGAAKQRGMGAGVDCQGGAIHNRQTPAQDLPGCAEIGRAEDAGVTRNDDTVRRGAGIDHDRVQWQIGQILRGSAAVNGVGAADIGPRDAVIDGAKDVLRPISRVNARET